MYTCVCVCMYVFMYVRIYLCIYARVCVYIYIYICVCVCVCVFVCVRIYTCIYMYVYKMFYIFLIEQLSSSSHFTPSQILSLRFILKLSLFHSLSFPVSCRGLQLKSSINLLLSECACYVFTPMAFFYIRLRHYHVTENERPPYAHLFMALQKIIYLSKCQFCTAYFLVCTRLQFLF